ncbi:MAG: alpha/beta hydrolase [Pseudomonadota bacterium]
MFEYDHLAPLQVAQLGAVNEAGAIIHDVTYASPLGGRVPAYLVIPEVGVGPFAGLIYLHPGEGNRSSYLPEAVAMAGAGVVSLLIDAPFLRRENAHWASGYRPLAEEEAALYRQIVLDLRRAVDLLSNRVDVDPARIGYVGHSLGATWGGPLAGVEHRIRAFVLMAGFPSLSDWYRTGTHPAAVRFRKRFDSPAHMESYLSVLEPLEAVRHLGRARGSFLFQFADADPFISRAAAERYLALAPEPKSGRWYETDHLFTGCTPARLDRAGWLAGELGLGALPEPVLQRLAGL